MRGGNIDFKGKSNDSCVLVMHKNICKDCGPHHEESAPAALPPYIKDCGRILGYIVPLEKEIVSKLYYRYDEEDEEQIAIARIRKEIEIAKTLFGIDPTNKYFLYPFEWCKVLLNSALHESDISELHNLCIKSIKEESKHEKQYNKLFNNEIQIFRMKEGPISLESLSNDRQYKDFFDDEQIGIIYDKILECLGILQSHGLTHGDLTPGNILIDANNIHKDADFIKLIDFSDSVKRDLSVKQADDMSFKISMNRQFEMFNKVIMKSLNIISKNKISLNEVNDYNYFRLEFKSKSNKRIRNSNNDNSPVREVPVLVNPENQGYDSPTRPMFDDSSYRTPGGGKKHNRRSKKT